VTRLKSRFLVDLLIRRAEAAGGFATVLAKGDDTAGIILVQCCDRGEPGPLLERRFSADGHYIWEAVGPTDAKDGESRANYQDRRRKGRIPICGSSNWISQMRHDSSRSGAR
jgi:hypothetical protein